MPHTPAPGLQRFFLDISYRGTSYHGWQRQTNAPSVQETVEDCLTQVLGRSHNEKVTIQGSGRTDTGVHALRQVAHVDLPEETDLSRLYIAVNGTLPADIALRSIHPVKPEAHARFSAFRRRYIYVAMARKTPFASGMAAWLRGPVPDLERMNAAADILLQHEDFQSFSRSKTNVTHFRCQLQEARWHQEGELFIFEVASNRFLRGMVRAIVGTTWEVGMGFRPLATFEDILLHKDRRYAGRAAPAVGLYFANTEYNQDIFLENPLQSLPLDAKAWLANPLFLA